MTLAAIPIRGCPFDAKEGTCQSCSAPVIQLYNTTYTLCIIVYCDVLVDRIVKVGRKFIQGSISVFP
jgi:hypothetical protein